MRIVLYILILALLFFVPLERTDVAKLRPIEAVAIYNEGSLLVLETNTEDVGRGEDAESALQNLIENTPAVVYLDTAEYLFVSEGAIAEVDALGAYLKPSVKVCVCEVSGHVQDAVKFAEVHGNWVQLKDWNAANKATK